MKALWLVLLMSSLQSYAAVPVWIDTDPSVAPGEHEIDDGYALWQAFRSPEIVVRGVSVVFGNAPLAQAYPISRQIIREFGPRDLEPVSGAARASELGRETEATRAMAAALKKEKITILALGPATNVASLVKLHPELRHRIERVIAVAGRRPQQHFRTGSAKKPFRDFNFEMDPDAFNLLLQSGVPLVLAPWEISSQVWITKADLATLPVPDWLLRASVDWLSMWKREFGVDGFNPFDTLAVAFVTSPAWLHCEPMTARLQLHEDDTKPDATKRYLEVFPPDRSAGTPVTYCSSVTQQFKPDLLRRLRGGLDHTAWDTLLRRFTTNAARVDYPAWKASGIAPLHEYLDRLAAPWPGSLPSNDTKAALINAYNALTVRWILQNYPIASIWRTRRPFTEPRHVIDGKKVSLDDIETRLRNMGDPRVHGVLVCASISCPPLRRESYIGSTLDEQLDDNIRAWLADPQKNQLAPGHQAKVSMIFKWYKGDFDKYSQGVSSFLSRYAPVAPTSSLEYLPYRWGLNDTSPIGENYSDVQFYADTVKSKL